MSVTLEPVRKPVTPKAAKANAAEQESETPEQLNVGFEIDPNKTYIFETLVKSEFPRSENLGPVTKAFDPIQKRYRDMRYIPVAESIFVDEQDESFDNVHLEPLVFYRNVLYVVGEDRRKMEYMLNHPLYEHSPFRVANRPAFFTLADKDVQEEIKAKRHATEMAALKAIEETDFADLKPIARILFGITEDTDTAIKNRMCEIVKAHKKGSEQKSGAEKLLENIGNPALLRKYHIQTAIDNGIIAADMNQMRATWVDGNVFIMQLTRREPVKEITDWTFTSEGAKFYTQLRKKI